MIVWFWSRRCARIHTYNSLLQRYQTILHAQLLSRQHAKHTALQGICISAWALGALAQEDSMQHRQHYKVSALISSRSFSAEAVDAFILA